MGLRLRAASGTCKDNFLCTPYARTLIMVSRKRTRHLASLASRSGFIAERFWTRRLRWRVERAPTRSMSRAAMGASAVREPVVSARGAVVTASAVKEESAAIVAVAVEIEGIDHKEFSILDLRFAIG